MVRVERFSCVFFTAMAGNKARNTNQGRLYVVLCSELTEKVGFSGRKQDFNLALGMNNKICSR